MTDWDCDSLTEIRHKIRNFLSAADRVESLLMVDMRYESKDMIKRDLDKVRQSIDDLYEAFSGRMSYERKKDEAIHWGALMIKGSNFTNRSQFTNILKDMGYLDERA